MPKDELEQRVHEARAHLGLEQIPQSQAGQLSGGQRQRVAMGRAIVRQPAVFLMDEPLSNLDAKLRVQMRAEIAALQSRLGTTTVYVTHDQVEAMTLGHRVAVLRRRPAAAVRHAAGALRAAGERVRRGLHRLAGDEHLQASVRERLGQPRRLASLRAVNGHRARSSSGCGRSRRCSRPTGSRPGRGGRGVGADSYVFAAADVGKLVARVETKLAPERGARICAPPARAGRLTCSTLPRAQDCRVNLGHGLDPAAREADASRRLPRGGSPSTWRSS